MEKRLHDICDADEVAPGAMRRCSVDGLDVVLMRDEDGEFFALRNLCAHMGASLSDGVFQAKMTRGEEIGDYRISDVDLIVRCPWHGYEFDVRSGRCPGDPDRIRVKTFPVTVQDGRVLIER